MGGRATPSGMGCRCSADAAQCRTVLQCNVVHKTTVNQFISFEVAIVVLTTTTTVVGHPGFVAPLFALFAPSAVAVALLPLCVAAHSPRCHARIAEDERALPAYAPSFLLRGRTGTGTGECP